MRTERISAFMWHCLAGLAAMLAVVPADAHEIFGCTFAGRVATVDQDGEDFTYRFTGGLGGDLTIATPARSGRLLRTRILFARGSQEALRFRNGRYSYAVFADFRIGNWEGEDARDTSGLIVFRGHRVIARHVCDDSSGINIDPVAIDAIPADDMAQLIFADG